MSSGTILPAQPRQAIEKAGTLHSLLRTVNVVEEENRAGADTPAWVGGFEFQPESCNEALVWNPCRTPAGQLVRVRGPINALTGDFEVTNFDAAALVEITLNNLGGGLYDVIIDDPSQSGIVSDPAQPANNTDGIVENCIGATATDPDAIFHIEFELNGGGNVPAGIFVLDIPVSQVTGIVYAPSTTGAQATISIDTNLAFTTAGLANTTAALIDALINVYGNPVTLGIVPSATEVLVREVRCDTVLPAPALQKTISDTPENVSYAPYEIYTSVRCRRYAEGEDPDFDRKARTELQLATTKAVECELWDGALQGEVNPFCLNPNPSLVGAVGLSQVLSPVLNATTGEVAAVGPEEALASLIQALGNCGAGLRGQIHAPIFVVNNWYSGDVLNRNGQILETGVGGHPVIAGAGYSGSAPLAYRALAAAGGFSAQPDNTAWAYATGTVQVLLTQPRPIAFENPQVGSAHSQQSTVLENRTTVLFERTGAAVWDLCCTFAVLVDMCP